MIDPHTSGGACASISQKVTKSYRTIGIFFLEGDAGLEKTDALVDQNVSIVHFRC